MRKGEPWGRPAGGAPDVTIDGGDDAIAAAVVIRPGARVALAPTATSELARAASLAGGTADGERRTELPCDALRVVARRGSTEIADTLAVNMVVFGTAPDHQGRWSRSRAVRITIDGRVVHDGPATGVVVGSGQFLRAGDLIPRGHPGDGRAEVQVYAVPPRERAAMRARLPQGEHVPHPAIHQRTGRQVEIVSATGEWALEIDGVEHPKASHLQIGIVPEAFSLLV